MLCAMDSDSLEKLSDGVILLDCHGQISDFNRAAKPWLASTALAAKAIADMVELAIGAKIEVPVSVHLFPQSDPLTRACEVTLCRNGSNGFLLLFTPIRGTGTLGTTDWHANSVSDLISDEIRHELNDLVRELEAVQDGISEADLLRVGRHSQHLRSMFASMDELARIAQSGSMFPGERLSVLELLKEAIGLIPHRHCAYGINAPAAESADKIGYIYGNSRWMVSAFLGLLECMEEGAPSSSRIVLRVGQSGGYVSITAGSAVALEQGHAFRAPPEVPLGRAVRLQNSIRVPLARRIVELHGGLLTVHGIEQSDLDTTVSIESFIVQLPTGSPANERNKECETCAVNQQATVFALDLAALMPSQKSEAAISDDERSALMHIAPGKCRHHESSTSRR